jgi:hypothetical protein
MATARAYLASQVGHTRVGSALHSRIGDDDHLCAEFWRMAIPVQLLLWAAVVWGISKIT